MARGKSRISDTAAIVGAPYRSEQEHSISVRKIENGFITRTSSCNPHTGEYRSSEQFTKSAPNITPPKMDGRQRNGAGSETLADTKRYLGEDV